MSRAIDVLKAQRSRQSAIRMQIGGPFGDETLFFPNPRSGQPWNPTHSRQNSSPV